MVTRSIRWRLLLWLAFLLTAILAGFGLTAYQLHRQNLLGQIDDELERRVAAIRGELRPRLPGRSAAGDFGPGLPPPRRFAPGGSPPPRPGPDGRPDSRDFHDFHEGREPREPRELPLPTAGLARFEETDTNALYYVIWSRNGSVLRQSSNAPPSLDRPRGSAIDTRINTRTREPCREAFQFSSPGECVLVGRPVLADLAGLRTFAGWLVAAGTAVLALGLGGVWLLASRALRPVEAIGATASRISAGNLAERIDVAETDSELGRLAAVLNSTFGRLEAAFAQQRHFTADASHELRTPLTVLISEAQTALARDRSTPEYRDSLAACLEVAQQMRRLTESLLALARFDAGQQALDRQPVDLADCARACLDLVRPLAEQHNLTLAADLAPAVTLGDLDRLGQVITNLLSNAIHYNRPHGRIHVHTSVQDGEALLRVADTGIGIAPDDLPRVFERFFRADKARGRAEGRTGLGLAIAKAIVDAHGGRIEVASQPDHGTTVTARFPLPGRDPNPRVTNHEGTKDTESEGDKGPEVPRLPGGWTVSSDFRLPRNPRVSVVQPASSGNLARGSRRDPNP